MFDEKVKFICPFCKEETKARIAKLVQRGLYVAVESNLKDKKYWVYTPASAQAKDKSPGSGKKPNDGSPHSK